MITVGIPARNLLTYLHRAVYSVLERRLLPTQLIIVDDASDTPTHYWLDQLAHMRDDVTIIRNNYQEGFAYNANLILDAAKGDLIVLLNSDTVVTSGWDTALQSAVWRVPQAGAVGPSASCTHTPQALAEYRLGRFDLTDHEIELQGKAIAQRYSGQWEPLQHLGGFCYAITRCAFLDVGYFDERFGLGPYEENDYSDRIAEKGYRCIWVKDAYVHHFGGLTFNTEYAGNYHRLQERNKKLYEAKRNGSIGDQWVRRDGIGKLPNMLKKNDCKQT